MPEWSKGFDSSSNSFVLRGFKSHSHQYFLHLIRRGRFYIYFGLCISRLRHLLRHVVGGRSGAVAESSSKCFQGFPATAKDTATTSGSKRRQCKPLKQSQLKPSTEPRCKANAALGRTEHYDHLVAAFKAGTDSHWRLLAIAILPRQTIVPQHAHTRNCP